MSGFFTKVEVTDPRLIAETIWQNLPASQKVLLTEREYSSQEWAPLDQRHFRVEPENFRTTASVANIGALRATRLTGNGATETILRSEIDGFGLLDSRAGLEPVDPSGNERTANRQCHDRIYLSRPAWNSA